MKGKFKFTIRSRKQTMQNRRQPTTTTSTTKFEPRTVYEAKSFTQERLGKLTSKQHSQVQSENSIDSKFSAVLSICLSLGNLWMTHAIESSHHKFNSIGLLSNLLSSIGFIVIAYRVVTVSLSQFVTLDNLSSHKEKKKSNEAKTSGKQSKKGIDASDYSSIKNLDKRIQRDFLQFLEAENGTNSSNKKSSSWITYFHLDYLWQNIYYLMIMCVPLSVCLLSIRLSYIESLGMNRNNMFELAFPAVLFCFALIVEYIIIMMNERVNDVNSLYSLLYEVMRTKTD
jgi:hypothetical protein